MVRLHYIDNLRWMSILLVFVVHAAVVFSDGWFGYYVTSAYSSEAALVILLLIMPWLMLLLFCIAGISTRFALAKRAPTIYLKERVVKLLVPFLAGIVLLCPIFAYFGMKSHGYPDVTFPEAVVHFFSTWNNIRDPTGFTGDFDMGHLWFIGYLFVISVIALGFILLAQKQQRTGISPATVSLPFLLILVVPLWLLNGIGPGVDGYTLASYFAVFLFGYYFLSDDAVLARLENRRVFLVAFWAVLTLCLLAVGAGILPGGSAIDDITASPLAPLTGWVGVLAVLGTGRHLLNRTGRAEAYLSASSYPIYILQSPVLVAVAWYVVALPVAPLVQYFLILAVSIPGTFALYEIIRRLPGVRVLFGIAGTKKEMA